MRDELAALDTGLPELAWPEVADRGRNGAISSPTPTGAA